MRHEAGVEDQVNQARTLLGVPEELDQGGRDGNSDHLSERELDNAKKNKHVADRHRAVDAGKRYLQSGSDCSEDKIGEKTNQIRCVPGNGRSEYNTQAGTTDCANIQLGLGRQDHYSYIVQPGRNIYKPPTKLRCLTDSRARFQPITVVNS